jgi:hypothetical protein
MNQNNLAAYQRFLKGDLHVNGWQSDWQKDLIRRRAEEEAKEAAMKAGRPKGEARKFAEAVGISARQVRNYGYERLSAMKPEALRYTVNSMKKSKVSA